MIMINKNEENAVIGDTEHLHGLSMVERISPKVTPALGLQSYEWFATDGPSRLQMQQEFIDNERDTIPLTYTKLFDESGNLISLDEERKSLEDLMRDLRTPESDELDDQAAEMTFYTALYRYYELDFIQTVQALNSPDATQEELVQTAEKYRRLDEALYGKPDPERYSQIKGEIWHVIDSKVLHPEAEKLKDELENGFVNERGIPISPLERSVDRLPEMDTAASDWAVEILKNDYGQYLDLVKEYWKNIIKTDGRTEFTNDDLYEVFRASLALMDPDNMTGISIVRKEGSSVLSWDTPTMSVGVGTSERKTVVDSPEKAFAKVLHELVAWHGGRTQKGLKTNAPILGFGVFSQFDEGERPDYLTFEEGIASLTESMIAGEISTETMSQWTAERLRLYANDSQFTLDQKSEREVYEITWRYTLLMGLSDNEQPTTQQIAVAQKAAASSQDRYRRSVPHNLPSQIGMIGFHKDTNYLEGRAVAIGVIQDLYEQRDDQSFRNLQATKIDPTNRLQREFAAKYGYPVQLKVVA